MALLFLLGPVPWSLSTSSPNFCIEPALYWPCSAGHSFDGNAVTTEHNSFSCHLQGSDGTSIQPGTKGRVCWFCFCLFVCFVALRPKSTAMVIAGRSVHLTTLFLGKLEQAVNQYFVHILSLVTDNNPS